MLLQVQFERFAIEAGGCCQHVIWAGSTGDGRGHPGHQSHYQVAEMIAVTGMRKSDRTASKLRQTKLSRQSPRQSGGKQ